MPETVNMTVTSNLYAMTEDKRDNIVRLFRTEPLFSFLRQHPSHRFDALTNIKCLLARLNLQNSVYAPEQAV